MRLKANIHEPNHSSTLGGVLSYICAWCFLPRIENELFFTFLTEDANIHMHLVYSKYIVYVFIYAVLLGY